MLPAKEQQLFELFAGVEIINIAASILTNLFLIYLILYRSSPEIGSYRYLLLAFAINDINYPIVHYLTLPIVCTYDGALVMFSRGIITSRVSICLFACTFSQTMPLLAHLFIYRLIAAKWPHFVKFYTAKMCFALAVITLAAESSLWFLNCYFNYGPDQATTDFVQPFLDRNFPGEGKGFIGALYYGPDGEFRIRPFLGTMGFNTIMGICISAIMFCSYSIVAHFRQEFSYRQLQMQLFRTLVIQMLIPMLIVYLPSAGNINLPMAGYRISFFPNLISASTTFYPLVDAWVIIYGVRSYRNTITNSFLCLHKASIGVSTFAQSSSLPNQTTT